VRLELRSVPETNFQQILEMLDGLANLFLRHASAHFKHRADFIDRDLDELELLDVRAPADFTNDGDRHQNVFTATLSTEF
jgi:hypothetical protein